MQSIASPTSILGKARCNIYRNLKRGIGPRWIRAEPINNTLDTWKKLVSIRLAKRLFAKHQLEGLDDFLEIFHGVHQLNSDCVAYILLADKPLPDYIKVVADKLNKDYSEDINDLNNFSITYGALYRYYMPSIMCAATLCGFSDEYAQLELTRQDFTEIKTRTSELVNERYGIDKIKVSEYVLNYCHVANV